MRRPGGLFSWRWWVCYGSAAFTATVFTTVGILALDVWLATLGPVVFAILASAAFLASLAVVVRNRRRS